MKTKNLKFKIKGIFHWLTATRFRKVLSCLLVVLTVLMSVKFIFLSPKEVQAADVYLGLDEGYGTSSAVHDTNSTVSAGTITNAVWKTEDLCKEGKCLYFDGTGDYVSFADSASLDMAASDTVTVEAWFRTPDITSGTRTLLAKEEATGADGGYRLEMNSSGQIVFGIDSDNTSYALYSLTSPSAYDDNLWHHVAAVKNGTASMQLYLDGIAAGSISIASTAADNDDSFYLGTYYNGSSSNAWLGFIDEVKVLRTARTQAEIKADFTGGTPNRGTSTSFGPSQDYLSNGLVGYWKMDETSGNLTDYSSNGYTLTNNGTTTFVTGKFGNGSEHVPASTQYFSTASTISGVKSFSFWTNPDSNTNYYLSLTSGAYLTSTSGILSAIGITNAKIYVNGVNTTTITANVWSLVTVTSDTAINANQFYLGRQGSNYYDGTLDETRLYTRTLSPAEVQKLYSWAPGPVGHWKMDEGTGTSAYDSSGTGYTGYLVSGIISTANWSQGKYGSAAKFDGVDDAVAIGKVLDMTSTDAFTIEAWVYRTSIANDSYIISKKLGYSSTEAGFNLYQFSLANMGNVCFYVTDASSNQYETCTADHSGEALNTWQHIAAVYDNASTVGSTIYLNGVNAEYATYELGNPATVGDTTVDRNLCIGVSGDSDNNPTDGCDGVLPFPGRIDDVRIYKYARTQAQIVEDMNGGHPAPGSPVGSATSHWKFDEGYSTTAYDSSINANNLTLSAAGWTNSGKFGKAYDGATNRRLTRADDDDFDFANGTDEFTISLWFNRGGAISAQEYLVDKHATNDGYDIYMDSDGDIVCGIGDGTSLNEDTAGTTAANYDDTNWHHAVCVKSGTSSLKLYIDGKEVASDVSLAADADMSNSGKLIIGDTNETDGTDEWLGDIDELKIYRLAFTPDQVKTEFNHGSATVMGSTGTTSTGTASNSETDAYCPPGQGSTCVGPILEYKFEENTGSTAYSTGTSSLNGTIATATYASSKYGTGMFYDNVEDEVLFSSNSMNSSTGTISLWYKPTNNFASSGSTQLIGKGNGALNGEFYLTGDGSDLYWGIYAGNDQFLTIPGADIAPYWIANQWVHLTIAYDIPNDDLYFYANGILLSSNTSLNFTTWTPSSTWYIGNRNGNDVHAKGTLDNVRIYNYVRTPAQIAWDYNRGGPVGWWKLDETSWNGTTDEVKDSSGFSQHGFREGNATTTSSGKYNYGGTFDGTGDDVWIDNDTPIFIEGSFTLATWFNATVWPGNGFWDDVISKQDGNNGYYIEINDTNDINCGFNDGAAYRDHEPPSFDGSTGTWYHVACVFDDINNTFKIYIDGKEIYSATENNGSPVGSGAALTFGSLNGSSQYYSGKLDDVRVYNYPLNATQVKLLYNENSAVRY